MSSLRLSEKSAALRGEHSRCQSLINRAALATLRGQLDEARTLDEELLTIAQAESNDYYIASALLDLAWIAALDQRFDDAARSASESLNFDLRVGQRLGVAEAMLIGALVNGSRGFEDDAARLVGAGAAQRQRLDQRPFNGPIYERAFQELEREIGKSFAAPCRRGGAGVR